MIAHLTGHLLDCQPDHVVLDVAGVGFLLQVPVTTYSLLARGQGNRGPVTLHVHTHLREDALQLFGFCAAEEKLTFQELLGISGVGPRMALALLSGIGVEELRQCVTRGDSARLQRIPGVGKKTAERLILELQHRWETPRRRSATGRRPESEGVPDATSGARNDAVSALTNLGYGEEVAHRAVDAAIASRDPAHRAELTLEQVLRDALTRLAR